MKFMIGLGTEQWILIALLAVMVIVLIVLPMFTNKRRNKAVNELYSSIRPGDIIKTVGGIIGEVKEIKELTPTDKQMVIETGMDGNKTTMIFDIQAVYQVVSKANAPAAEPFAAETKTEAPAEPKAEEPVVENKAEESVEPKTEAVAVSADETAAAEVPAEAPEKPAAKPAAAKKPAAAAKGKTTTSKPAAKK